MSEVVSRARLEAHVTSLAGEIGERNVFRPGTLDAARDYIAGVWTEQGVAVTALTYRARDVECANLEVTLPGESEEVFVIGAHYDSVHGSPGANDNGSGVAAMLELSRLLADLRSRPTLRFVAFVNEEPPFFWWGSMGSMVYARRAKSRGDRVVGMISLETIGYYSDAPGSQRYPPLLRWFYPDRGNFLGFVANLRSRALLRRLVAAFQAASSWPIESAATFGWLPGISWSDHLAFWRQGWPAAMITDTALYRYPWYHTADDTPDKVDFQALTQVTQGLDGMLRRVCGVVEQGQKEVR